MKSEDSDRNNNTFIKMMKCKVLLFSSILFNFFNQKNNSLIEQSMIVSTYSTFSPTAIK